MAKVRLRLDNTDLFRHLRIAEDEGFEPSSVDFIQPSFGDSVGEGSALLSKSINNAEPEIPLHIRVRDVVDGTVIQNDVLNPRFATDVNNWTVSGGGGALTRSTSWAAVGGGSDSRAACGNCAFTAVGGDTLLAFTSLMPVKQIDTVNAMGVVKVVTTVATDTLNMAVFWYKADGTNLGSTNAPTPVTSPATNGIYRFDLGSVSPPFLASEIAFYRIVFSYVAVGGAGARVFQIGCAMGVRNSGRAKLLYHDGDSPGWNWNGAIHGSSSSGQAVPYANYLWNPAPSLDTIGQVGTSIQGWSDQAVTYNNAVDVIEDSTSPLGSALRIGPDSTASAFIQNDSGGVTTVLQHHVLPGDWICYSAWMKANAAAQAGLTSSSQVSNLRVFGFNSVGANLDAAAAPDRTNTGWQRVSITQQVPDNASSFVQYVYGRGASVAGADTRFAGFVLARGSTQAEAEAVAKNLGGDSFFDGDSIDAEWAPRSHNGANFSSPTVRTQRYSYRYSGKDGYSKTRQGLDAICDSAALFEWRDDGASRSTFRDVQAGRFEHEYVFRRAQHNWISGRIHLWTKPIAHSGTLVTPATVFAASFTSAIQVPLPFINGDRPAELLAQIQVGSNPVPHGRIVGFFTAPSGRPAIVPAASIIPGPSSARVGASGAFGSQAIVWSSPTGTTDQEVARVAFSPTQMIGRSRILGFAMGGSRKEQLYAVDNFGNQLSPQGALPSHMQGYGLVDLGVVDFGSYGYNALGVDAGTAFVSVRTRPHVAGAYIGAHATPVATALLSGLIFAPEDSLQMVVDTDRRLLAWDDFRMGLSSVDQIGNAYSSTLSFSAASQLGVTFPSIGIATLFAGRVAVDIPTTAYFEVAAAFRVSNVNVNQAYVAKRHSAGFDYLMFQPTNASVGYIALNVGGVLVGSAAVPSIMNLGSTFAGELIMRHLPGGLITGEIRSTYGVRASNEPDPTLATLGFSSPLADTPGQVQIGITAVNSASGIGDMLTGFRVTELPTMSMQPRDFYRFTASGVQRTSPSGYANKNLPVLGALKPTAGPGGNIQAYAFEQSLHDGPAQSVMSAQVYVRERFTYAQ